MASVQLSLFNISRRYRVCKVGGCSRKHYGRGWCKQHYTAWWSHRARPCSVDGCSEKAVGSSKCRGHYKAWRAQQGARCEVSGCNRVSIARGFCDAHYQRHMKYGDPGPAKIKRMHKQRGCRLDGCDGIHYARDMCKPHYDQWKAKNNPDMIRRISARRRAKIKSIGGDFSEDDWKRLLSRWENRCAYGVMFGSCKAERRDDLTIGHIIPVARGGSNYIGNILPICTNCNYTQWTYLLAEWRMKRGLTLGDGSGGDHGAPGASGPRSRAIAASGP